MKKVSTYWRNILAVGLALAIIGDVYWLYRHWQTPPKPERAVKASHNRPNNQSAITIPHVRVATAAYQDIPIYISGLGVINAANHVVVRSQVEGQLQAIHFREGDVVQPGELLAEIDSRPYQIALQQAQAQLEKDRASLKSAQRDWSRYQQLAAKKLVSAQQLEEKQTLLNERLALIKADDSQVASAQLNLTYCRIVSPIQGTIGLKRVDIGNFISRSDSDGLVVITQTQPVFALFSLPASALSQIQQVNAAKRALQVEIWDQDNSKLIAVSDEVIMDNQIDSATSTIKFKATLPNRDNALFPSQFINARLHVDSVKKAVTVPITALQRVDSGSFVWIVDDNSRAQRRSVSLGPQYNQQIAITNGINVGERVVTDGLDNLFANAKVDVVAQRTNHQQQAQARE